MKKLIVIIALALFAFSANAQVYVGGALSFFPGGGGTGVFTLAPEVGYNLSSNTAVGARVSFDNQFGTTFALNPYYRYGFKTFGDVMLFIDAELQIQSNTNGGNNTTTFGAGVVPGAAMQLSDNISVVASFGQIGYYGGGFTLNFSTAPGLAFYYHF